MQASRGNIMTALRYRNAPAAIDWLCRVFGFEPHTLHFEADGSIAHAELTLGGSMIMLGAVKDDDYGSGFRSPDELGGVETRSAYLVMEGAGAAYARALAAGAAVVRPLQETNYGSREFTVKDPEGHSWSVGTYDPWAPH